MLTGQAQPNAATANPAAAKRISIPACLRQRARWLEAMLDVAEVKDTRIDSVKRPAPRCRVKGTTATHLTEPLRATPGLTSRS